MGNATEKGGAAPSLIGEAEDQCRGRVGKALWNWKGEKKEREGAKADQREKKNQQCHRQNAQKIREEKRLSPGKGKKTTPFAVTRKEGKKLKIATAVKRNTFRFGGRSVAQIRVRGRGRTAKNFQKGGRGPSSGEKMASRQS